MTHKMNGKESPIKLDVGGNISCIEIHSRQRTTYYLLRTDTQYIPYNLILMPM